MDTSTFTNVRIRRHRRDALCRSVLVQATAFAPSAARRCAAPNGRDRRRRALMPGSEAHTHFSWNDGRRRHPDDAARGARALRQDREEVPRGRLDLRRRRRLRQAAPRCRTATRRSDPWPRYSPPARRSRCRRPGRMPHLPFPEFSWRQRQLADDEEGGAFAASIRSLNLGRHHPGFAGRDHLDERRRGRRGDGRGAGARRRHVSALGGVAAVAAPCIDVIYRASYSDSESLDMLEAAKDRVFVAPASPSSWRCSTRPSRGASPTPRQCRWATCASGGGPELLRAMHGRGIRILPGGDYGWR